MCPALSPLGCVSLFLFFKRIEQQMWTFLHFLGLKFYTFNLNKTSDCREKNNIEHKTTHIKFKKKEEHKKWECCAWDLTKYTIYCCRFASSFRLPLSLTGVVVPSIIVFHTNISWRFDCRFVAAATAAAPYCYYRARQQ